MFDIIQTLLPVIGENLNDILVCGIIMVSAIIVAIGLLKPLIFNKIKNKHIRKVALAITNVAACFLTVLGYFLVCGWSFENYLVCAIGLSVSCIVTYWLYENTCLRNLIELIGNMALRKMLSILTLAASTDDIKAVEAELKKAGRELKAHTKKQIKEDKDLNGL